MKTSKVLNEQFAKLQDSYNSNQTTFPALLSQYAPDVQEQKKKLHLETNVNIYKPQFQSLLNETDLIIKSNIAAKNVIKFPLSSSDNTNDRLLGEQKKTNARLLFAEFNSTPGVLADELQNLVDSGDLDSAFSLIDIVMLSVGDTKSEELKDFNFIKDVLNQNSGINTVDSELKDLQFLQENVNKVIAALNEGTPYLLMGYQTSQMQDNDFFNLQNKLKDLFGESNYQKIKRVG